MKQYHVELSVSIKQGNPGDYAPDRHVYFTISEMLPKNVDAQKYLRQRLAEELKRHFNALIDQIDNQTDEVKSSIDPLDDMPF